MKHFFTAFLIGGMALACRSEEPDIVWPINPPVADTKEQDALSKKLYKDRLLDTPTFDDSNTDRQLPYSPGAVPVRPRLISANDVNYRYDSLGRLLEGYVNYIGTDQPGVLYTYQYDKQGLLQFSSYWGGFPGASLTITQRFRYLTNQAGRIDSYYDDNNKSKYLLRFDKDGYLIWAAKVKGDPNFSTEVGGYRRAIRDANHNVHMLRSSLDEAYTTEYDYDDKPNPFYQLGGAPDFTSPNNVTKETKRDVSGNLLSVTEYFYDYRADGYPIRKRSETGVIEYTYAD